MTSRIHRLRELTVTHTYIPNRASNARHPVIKCQPPRRLSNACEAQSAGASFILLVELIQNTFGRVTYFKRFCFKADFYIATLPTSCHSPFLVVRWPCYEHYEYMCATSSCVYQLFRRHYQYVTLTCLLQQCWARSAAVTLFAPAGCAMPRAAPKAAACAVTAFGRRRPRSACRTQAWESGVMRTPTARWEDWGGRQSTHSCWWSTPSARKLRVHWVVALWHILWNLSVASPWLRFREANVYSST